MTKYNLGPYRRAITHRGAAAKAAFDEGLNWLFGFNHEAAHGAFQRAVRADPDCAMAHWGIAYALGPNYNHGWDTFTDAERARAVNEGRAAVAAARRAPDQSPVEMALCEAVAARIPSHSLVEDFAPWNTAFADAMRRVHETYPDDLDVAALTAEALMVCTPWALWDTRRGVPAKEAHTVEARGILERAFETQPEAWRHPGLLHMYIHLMEMSPTPELALPHGDALTELCPDAGHLIHMGSHIDLLCGDYHNVVARNHRAAAADRIYAAAEGGQNFYTLYRLHNLHFATYGALFLGQRKAAFAAAEALAKEVPDEVVAVYPDLFEAFVANRAHVYLRFGAWEEILAHPVPEDAALYSFTQATWAYARTVALANLARPSEAEAAFADFLARRDAIPEKRMLFQNSARDVLAIAEAMARGEMAFKSGAQEAGLASLREAVARDDALLYEEPWAWMQPTRHALGALLMEAGHVEEAEAVYRADLGLDGTLPRPCQHPGNVWSLHGLAECLARRDETIERPHIEAQLARAMARADVPIRASCACRNGATETAYAVP